MKYHRETMACISKSVLQVIMQHWQGDVEVFDAPAAVVGQVIPGRVYLTEHMGGVVSQVQEQSA